MQFSSQYLSFWQPIVVSPQSRIETDNQVWLTSVSPTHHQGKLCRADDHVHPNVSMRVDAINRILCHVPNARSLRRINPFTPAQASSFAISSQRVKTQQLSHLCSIPRQDRRLNNVQRKRPRLAPLRILSGMRSLSAA